MRIPGRRRVQGSLPGSATIGPGATQTSTSDAMGSKSARKWTELLFTMILRLAAPDEDTDVADT